MRVTNVCEREGLTFLLLLSSPHSFLRTDFSLSRSLKRLHHQAMAARPRCLPPDERLSALCEILAAGLVRLHHRQSSRLSSPRGDSCLDLPLQQSGHAEPKFTGGARA